MGLPPKLAACTRHEAFSAAKLLMPMALTYEFIYKYMRYIAMNYPDWTTDRVAQAQVNQVTVGLRQRIEALMTILKI